MSRAPKAPIWLLATGETKRGIYRPPLGRTIALAVSLISPTAVFGESAEQATVEYLRNLRLR